MTKRMLIDCSHPEETRVAVLHNNRLEDFDVEVASRKQLKGNIYLAKVTRVEPSLQAAFIDYGGNRHGFLAFSEIHPDYYQIPVEDREALLAEQRASQPDDSDDGDNGNGGGNGESGESVETVGGDDTEEVTPRRSAASHRNYKIQEVVKRNQILLIQVVKEERGNKGAALTTYISLAGRYCVLMPNTARGGGISRKIASSKDRSRLKTMLKDLSIPDGIAVIVRTAGSQRSKAEIKRDYEYLMRLWGQVREMTLESTAPSLVHEEGNLIKRTIRDLYDSDIEDVTVAGDEGYRLAKDFMKLLIPSHAKKVQPYKETNEPMFTHFKVENQLDAMHSPEVQLKSGGYIVINPTEALVSIDVNSGRSTRERNIEETALKTNLEASDEVARQLRLRDLAGLIVIDYIDMEKHRNQTQVERRLKDGMRNDRARIQLGRISPFGLLEMSRQRLRPSLLETSFETCPYCEGTGTRRSTDTTALHVLRAIEEEALKKSGSKIVVYVPTAVALFILNNKRVSLAEIEAAHNVVIQLENDDTLIPPNYRFGHASGTEQRDPHTDRPSSSTPEDSSGDASKRKRRRRRGRRNRSDEDVETTSETTTSNEENTKTDSSEDSAATESSASSEDASGDEEAPRRRRRGRRGGRRRGRSSAASGENAPATEGETASADATASGDKTPEAAAVSSDGDATSDAKSESKPEAKSDDAEAPKKPTRRRRATRRKTSDADAPAEAVTAEATEAPKPEAAPKSEAAEEEKPKPRRRSRKKADTATATDDKPAEAVSEEKPEKPAKAAKADKAEKADKPAKAEKEDKPAKKAKDETKDTAAMAKTTVINVEEVAEKKTRKGWWSS